MESQKIDFTLIQGTKNILTDMLSRLIEIDNDIKLPAEEEGHKFRYVQFEQLPPAQVVVMEEVIINKVTNGRIHIQHTDPGQLDLQIELPITNMKMKELQEQDKWISHLRKLWHEKKLNRNLFTMENDILKRKIVKNALLYKPVIIPDVLKETL